jgi:hypothetical protein
MHQRWSERFSFFLIYFATCFPYLLPFSRPHNTLDTLPRHNNNPQTSAAHATASLFLLAAPGLEHRGRTAAFHHLNLEPFSGLVSEELASERWLFVFFLFSPLVFISFFFWRRIST